MSNEIDDAVKIPDKKKVYSKLEDNEKCNEEKAPFPVSELNVESMPDDAKVSIPPDSTPIEIQNPHDEFVEPNERPEEMKERDPIDFNKIEITEIGNELLSKIMGENENQIKSEDEILIQTNTNSHESRLTLLRKYTDFIMVEVGRVENLTSSKEKIDALSMLEKECKYIDNLLKGIVPYIATSNLSLI